MFFSSNYVTKKAVTIDSWISPPPEWKLEGGGEHDFLIFEVHEQTQRLGNTKFFFFSLSGFAQQVGVEMAKFSVL